MWRSLPSRSVLRSLVNRLGGDQRNLHYKRCRRLFLTNLCPGFRGRQFAQIIAYREGHECGEKRKKEEQHRGVEPFGKRGSMPMPNPLKGTKQSRAFVLRVIIVSYLTVRKETVKCYLSKPTHRNGQTSKRQAADCFFASDAALCSSICVILVFIHCLSVSSNFA